MDMPRRKDFATAGEYLKSLDLWIKQNEAMFSQLCGMYARAEKFLATPPDWTKLEKNIKHVELPSHKGHEPSYDKRIVPALDALAGNINVGNYVPLRMARGFMENGKTFLIYVSLTKQEIERAA